MRRIVEFIRDRHEPVQPWEFRLFACVGVALAIAAVFACTAVLWSDARQAATTTGYELARR